MQTRRSLIALAFAAAVAAALPASPARADTDPQAFVASLGNRALETLTQTQLSDAEREARFRELFVEHFDVQAIGRTVLGRYWRSATPEEKAEYLQLFEDFIVKSYAARFKTYSGEQFAVEGIKEDRDGYATVQSVVTSPSGEPVNVFWRVRSKDGQLKIVDVVVEGVSMVITQQRDFASVVQKHGGSVEGLIAELRQKTASMQ